MKAKILLFLFCLLAACSSNQTMITPTASEVPLTETPLSTTSPSPTAPNPNKLGFSDSGQYMGETLSFYLSIADVDLDNDLDIFFPNYGGANLLFINDGSGGFSRSGGRFGSSETHSAEMADLNGDGYPDIFMVNHHAPAKVFLNNGSGGFSDSGQELEVASENPSTVVFGDVDSDGDVDAFIIHPRQPNYLWLNDGRGFFNRSETGYGGTFSVAMALVDVNDDGVLEMILCEHGRPAAILTNDGSGNFTDTGISAGDPIGDEIIDSGDIDGDGDIDLALGNVNTGVQVWLNQNNTGSFTAAGPAFEPLVMGFRLIDADLDGDLDLITASWETGTKLWLNEGAGSFSPVGLFFDESLQVLSIGVGKLDADEDLDIVFGISEGQGGNKLYFNDFLVEE